uniref:Uncharacterized protein n=2 Tax=Trichogramma kaykai TaxID=54128 RepID=A0ABD2WZS5_9HYME
MLTESSPLAPSSPSFGAATGIPFYAKDTHKFYSRRRKERQLQCIMFFTILATFIMALVITISYTIYNPLRSANDIDSKKDDMVTNSTPVNNIIPSSVAEDSISNEVETMHVPQTVLLSKKDSPQLTSKTAQTFINNNLDENELQKAIIAGKEAIRARQLADAQSDTLPPHSPSFLHQYAVNTNELSDEIAMVGVAEIAATKEIENERNSSGKPSSFGNFIKNEWISDNICMNEISKCEDLNGEYRTIDGSCNNPKNLGMAFTPFSRLLQPDYSNGIDSPRTSKLGSKLPSARKISYMVN